MSRSYVGFVGAWPPVSLLMAQASSGSGSVSFLMRRRWWSLLRVANRQALRTASAGPGGPYEPPVQAEKACTEWSESSF
jgi:hypothetical protein